MADLAPQEAIDWLDNFVEDGSYLFVYDASGDAPVYAAAPDFDHGGRAYVITDVVDGPVVGRNSVHEQWSSDRPLTDEELQHFLDAYGFYEDVPDDPLPEFKPVDGSGNEPGDVDCDATFAEFDLPSLDYVHVDAIKKFSRATSELIGWELDRETDGFITQLRAFEALRRAEL